MAQKRGEARWMHYELRDQSTQAGRKRAQESQANRLKFSQRYVPVAGDLNFIIDQCMHQTNSPQRREQPAPIVQAAAAPQAFLISYGRSIYGAVQTGTHKPAAVVCCRMMDQHVYKHCVRYGTAVIQIERSINNCEVVDDKVWNFLVEPSFAFSWKGP